MSEKFIRAEEVAEIMEISVVREPIYAAMVYV